jgi:hypothetical protein
MRQLAPNIKMGATGSRSHACVVIGRNIGNVPGFDGTPAILEIDREHEKTNAQEFRALISWGGSEPRRHSLKLPASSPSELAPGGLGAVGFGIEPRPARGGCKLRAGRAAAFGWMSAGRGRPARWQRFGRGVTVQSAGWSLLPRKLGRLPSIQPPAAEAWARSTGATDAEIEAARLCIKDRNSPMQTAAVVNSAPR